MIGPSRRRRSGAPRQGDLELHRRLAHGRDLHLRLGSASLGALLGSLLALFSGQAFEMRLILVLGFALLGALWPPRGSERWALRWIGQSSGLAYQTALEAGEESDPYGMHLALLERAKASAAKVEPPSRSAWWLPVLVLAFGLLLIPSLTFRGAGGTGAGSGPGGPTPTTTPPPPQEGEQQPDEPVPQLPQEEGPTRANAPGDDEQGSRVGADDAPRDAAQSEQEALDRFLDNFRERTRTEPEGEQANPGSEAPTSADEAPEDAQPRQGDTGGEEQANEQAGERDEGEGEGEQPAQGGGEEQPGGQEEQQGGEEGETGSEEMPNPFGQAGEGEEEGDPQGPAQGEGPEQGESLVEEEMGPGGDPPTGEGEEQPEGGEGAGAIPSAFEEAGVAEGEGDTLFLQGEMASDASNPGGVIQLPGSDEVDLPAGTSPAEYRREVERAVSEGRIPLEYQEIIRNYFR